MGFDEIFPISQVVTPQKTQVNPEGFGLWAATPSKTKMEPEDSPLEKEFSHLQTSNFWVPCVFFLFFFSRGYIYIYIIYLNLFLIGIYDIYICLFTC